MTREELEHAIRASCDLTNESEVIVFGSQAILGQFPNAPDTLRQSAEADVALKHAIDKVDQIDAMLGEESQFHRSHGFYVHGLRIEAAILPPRWEDRVIKVQNNNTRNCIGWCIEVHDLAASKLAAFREKDRDFVRVLLAEQMANPEELVDRIGQLSLQQTHKDRLTKWVVATATDLASTAPDLGGDD
jgi:hypothetical protein